MLPVATKPPRLPFCLSADYLPTKMNSAEKPELVLQIYLVVLRTGLAITAIYAARQIILIVLLLCNCRSRLIEVPEIEDHSLREEQGRLETNYLAFTTVDHLFKFDKDISPKRSKIVRKPKSPRGAARRSITLKVRDKEKKTKERRKLESVLSFLPPSVPQISQHEFQRSMIDEIDEYSIESSPVNESSLLALSDSERDKNKL